MITVSCSELSEESLFLLGLGLLAVACNFLVILPRYYNQAALRLSASVPLSLSRLCSPVRLSFRVYVSSLVQAGRLVRVFTQWICRLDFGCEREAKLGSGADLRTGLATDRASERASLFVTSPLGIAACLLQWQSAPPPLCRSPFPVQASFLLAAAYQNCILQAGVEVRWGEGGRAGYGGRGDSTAGRPGPVATCTILLLFPTNATVRSVVKYFTNRPL